MIDQYPAELSGGMQKRVALARAVADKPEILLFDEPTSGLDPITGGVIDNLIKDSVNRLGATAITISHDMASVRRIADKVAMIHQGKVIWCGPVDDMDHTGIPEVDQFVHGKAQGPLTTAMNAALKKPQYIMAKSTTRYVCSACGATSPKWSGKCDSCGEWNSMSEEASPSLSTPGKKILGRKVALEPLHQSADQPPLRRHQSGIDELDRVIGGGVVPGSAMLIGGDPGIGKSTL